MAKSGIQKLAINSIKPGKQHWKREHTKEDINTLADQINSVGLLHPITVRDNDGRMELVAGEKRLLACRKLGLKEIAACVVRVDDRIAELMSLYENLGQTEMTQADIDHGMGRAARIEAERLGVTTSSQVVIDTVALKAKVKPDAVKKAVKRDEGLIPEAKKALASKQISKAQADELRLLDPTTQQYALDEILTSKVSAEKMKDKRIANKGNMGKDDANNVDVRTAGRYLKRAVGKISAASASLADFLDFVETKKVNVRKFGTIPHISPLTTMVERISDAKKLLKN